MKLVKNTDSKGQKNTSVSDKEAEQAFIKIFESIFLICSLLNHLALSKSYLAPLLIILSMSNISINSLVLKTSSVEPGFQPIIHIKFINASFSKPISLNPI